MSEYLGDLNEYFSELFHKNLVESEDYDNKIPAIFFFYKKYKQIPCKYEDWSDGLFYPRLKEILKDSYNHNSKNDIAMYEYSFENNMKFATTILSDLDDGIMLLLKNGKLEEKLEAALKFNYTANKSYHVFVDFQIYYLPEKEEKVDNLIELLELAEMKKVTEVSLNMICRNSSYFYSNPITIKKPLITDLRTNYGNEFIDIHNTIINALKSEDSHGLILLHGLPGSGKTHYIRYLIQELGDKELMYVPPDLTASISSPEFLPFIIQIENSILIIEDAENIIKSRDSGETTTQAVANLLNLSDGLLGDSCRQPIIATFNCELNSIDPALLRKGRLITQYEFGKLSTENAQKLSENLGFRTKITEPMTLADIYNQIKEN